ncbi:hypothetical protein BH18ACT4_BH18ACT4_13700 [soil metagenome]
MARLRLGVALLLRGVVAEEINGLRRACGDGALGRIPVHVTLVPPVNVRGDELGAALSRLRAAAAATPGPLTLRLGPVATFHPDTPVVYLAVDDADGGVKALRDEVFHPPLAREVTWPFVPHVTVADEMDPARIPAAVAALADYRADTVVEGVHLLQEGPGRVWAAVADAHFLRPLVVGRGGLPIEMWFSDAPDPDTAALFGDVDAVPMGATPVTVTARREGAVLGAARGWRRDGSITLETVALSGPVGFGDVERHLRRALFMAERDHRRP